METFMPTIHTAQELEIFLGSNIKSLRLQKNLDRKSLCLQAGVSLNALKNLENGKGSTVMTLIKIMKSLGNEEWVHNLAPKVTIHPLYMVREKPLRQRARRRTKNTNENG